MALKPPVKRGLRVFHNSNTAQKATLTVPAGAELTVDVNLAAQLAAQSTHFEVDADALAEAKAEAEAEGAEKAEADAEAAHREYHRLSGHADAIDDGMMTHDEARTEEDRHICDVCGKETKTAGGLASHKRKHEDD